jgi:hypothetical protein
MDLMHAIASIPGIGPFLPWVPIIIALASAIASALPPESPFYRIVNTLAINIGQARNFSDPKA